MSPRVPTPAASLARVVAMHSLGWLVAANLVGVWLAVSVLWPAVGNLLAPLTYGRWVPLHLDWQLYGWCALPMVGALLAWFLDPLHPQAGRHAGWALAAWSLALVLGGIAWLGGNVSGKLFLDWHGWTRPVLPVAMTVLWMLLAWHARQRWQSATRVRRVAYGAVLAVLLPVPAVFFWSTARRVYPAVNPDSGGATGSALLGSTLGIITLFMLLPGFVGAAPRRRVGSFAWALAASWLVFGFIDRGHTSHHAAAQIAALGTLLLWAVLLPMFWSRHEWLDATRPWLRAAGAWWALLVVSGWVTFLPGVSEALKFTHALVGHAHLAMAGLLTSANAVILVMLTRRAAPSGVAWLWQAGCVVYVAAMLALGSVEADRYADLFRSETWTQGLLALRLAAGSAMAVASVRWLYAEVRS